MSVIIKIKKIKNTFLTPSYKDFYKNIDNYVKKKPNKYIKLFLKFFFKFFWFLPNIESHKYWHACQADENHGYKKYLDMNVNAKILISEIKNRIDKQSRILDLCCNVGRHLNSLSKLGYTNLYGVDINDLSIKKIKTIYKNLSSANVSCTNAESYLLKTESNYFDLIYTHGATVELIPPTFPIIKEVCRVTKNFVIFLIQENGHAYPRFWRYEFKKNKMHLIYFQNCSGHSLLVYKKSFQS